MILTTHDMDDIEALCNRVIVIGQGQILSDGTLNELRTSVTRERRLIVDLDEAMEVIDPSARVVEQEGGRITLAFDPEIISTAELIRRITEKYPVHDLYVQNPPIEQIISSLYENMGTAR